LPLPTNFSNVTINSCGNDVVRAQLHGEKVHIPYHPFTMITDLIFQVTTISDTVSKVNQLFISHFLSYELAFS